ncbi:hypothetical protein VOLCADRAFT_104439 [Volvox carteri f. nagariensis]|uniref:Uncharacterized protein n=1 Tax=Volvox carteri f. nagariensis TaxID=3068 RepID=D8TTM2_VOLCA|nr:uncharacterized protein VOLCADRAFT_104439 [Volvox carteri f. nagariensis]EFJ49223.1 hypothetical protein VOLCADRAFT_104439 [Volvox carteri f. nagariensis]|eukprot:XP_002949671.1 hypothetical protein VOLCADRAFT_104439 [Volvox carteri f. nagariensis]
MGEGGKRKSLQEEAPAAPSYRLLTSDELGLLKGASALSRESRRRFDSASLLVYRIDVTQSPMFRLESNGRRQQQSSAGASPISSMASPACRSHYGGGCALRRPARGPVEAVGAVEVGSFRAAPPATTSGRSDTSVHELRGLRLITTTAAAGPAGGGGGSSSSSSSHDELLLLLQRLRDVSSSGRHVAVGGEGHQLRVWDLGAANKAAAATAATAAHTEPLFAGKAGKPSRSGLQDLAHVTAVSYVPGRDDQLVLVGTAKHKLWLYDMRAGRKPQSEAVWGEGRITALLPQQDGTRVWVGNGRGQVEALDLRQAPGNVSMGHALKGSAGAIRSLSLHPTQPLIASVSLDRHLRVHSTTNRQLLTKVYLKQVGWFGGLSCGGEALTGVAWLPTAPKPPSSSARGADDGQEEEHEGYDMYEEEGEEAAKVQSHKGPCVGGGGGQGRQKGRGGVAARGLMGSQGSPVGLAVSEGDIVKLVTCVPEPGVTHRPGNCQAYLR